jgi:HEAT repeat protein
MFWADDVAHALGTFRDPRAVGVLLTRMAHPSSSEWTTKAMADALVAIAGRGLPRLLPQINSPDPSLRSATLEVLGRIGDRRAEPALVAALAKPDIARDASDVLAKMYANNVAHLLPLLHSKQTLAIAYGLIGLGKPGTEAALVAALMGLGDETLARFYLNCGNNQLEQAAHDWAASHGYVVVPGFGIGSPSWGKL